MFFLWMMHYSLVKGVYRRRWKGMTSSADGLAFFCLFVLALFLVVLLIDKELIWALSRKRLSLAPMVMGLALLLTPLLVFLLPKRLSKKKIRYLRRIVELKKGFRRIHSVLYICFFLSILVLTFAIIIHSRTPI